MYEGQNIHLSPVDGKRLCSFSQKICKQHRLNGYAFCIRHILEDKNAPFKQCQFNTKASGEKCFNPVPQSVDRVYCNSHLQVLGMLPKHPGKQSTEKKRLNKKEKCNSSNGKKVTACSKNNSLVHQQKLNKRARKLLGKDYVKTSKVKMNWYTTMTKVFKQTAHHLHSWQEQDLDTECYHFLKTRKYKRQNKDFFRFHVISNSNDEDDEIEEGSTSVIYQSVFLDSHERVHHNCLRVDSPTIQEQKMLLKLKHHNGQLKQSIASNLEKGSLSYSVLSKLISSARKNALQTANAMNIENGSSSFGSFRLYRERQEVVSYQVPCSLISGDECCTNFAMPYSRYCRDHISRDTNQFLFSADSALASDLTQRLEFLRGDELPSSNQFKRKGGIFAATQSKRPHQKLKSIMEEKRLKQKKSKTKKKANKRLVNSMRDSMQRKFDIPAQPSLKMNAHLKKTKEEIAESVYSKGELSSNSNSEEDDDNDILTPEEAFHLPPGSLSFSPRIVDDDSMPAIQNRNCSLDDEDDELIRCSNNFPFDSNNHISRDIGSPTLNQLSSSDFNSFNMFMSPAKTLESVTPVSLTSSSYHSQSFNRPVCSPNDITNVSSRISQSNQPIIANDQKPSSTVLKISPVDLFNKVSGKVDHNPLYVAKQHTNERNIKSGCFNSIPSGVQEKIMQQYRNNGLSSMANQHMTNANDPVNSYPHMSNGLPARSHISPMKDTIAYDQTSLSKRYLSDSLLMQQPLSQDNTLFEDINTDVGSPLEKVNPDIFFSSVFPVSTSTASI